MKKTITANIGGTVFHIEEDAFERLQRYLAGIRGQFSGSESAAEIMADIEARIAELFTQRMENRQVVNLDDVDHVIGVMGQPEDYLGEGGAESGPAQAASSTTGRTYKRLYRDTEDRWAGGVCAGVAHYLGMDPLVVRLMIAVLSIPGLGTPLLVYVIMWIMVPPAETAAEKLAMRGEPVNVDNIKRMFEEGADRFKKGAEKVYAEGAERFKHGSERVKQEMHDMGTRAERSGAREAAQGFFGVIGEMFRLFIRFLGKLFGAASLLLGAAAAVLLAILLFSRSGLFTMGDDRTVQDLGELSALVFTSPAQDQWAWVATSVFILVPVIGLLYGGISMLFDVGGPRWLAWVLTPLWIAAIVIMAVIGVRMASEVRVPAEHASDHVLATPAGNVLHLQAMNGPSGDVNWSMRYKHGHHGVDEDFFDISGDSIRYADADVDIRRSPDSLYHVVVVREARGYSHDEARERASNITGQWVQRDSTLRISNAVLFPKRDRFRAQEIAYIILVPLNGAVHIDLSVEHMLDDVRNVSDTWDWEMGGRTWTMTSEGLKDLKAPGEEGDEDEEKADTLGGTREDPPAETLAATVFRGPARKPAPSTPSPYPARASAGDLSITSVFDLLGALVIH